MTHRSLALLLILPLLAAATPAEFPDPLAFGARPDFGDARLSPDGRQIAIERIDEISSTLLVVDAGSLKPTAELGFRPHEGVHGIAWANDATVLVGRHYRYNGLDTPSSAGELIAISADGKRQTYLFGVRADQSRRDKGRPADLGAARVIDTLRGDTGHVLVLASDWSRQGEAGHQPVVYRINVDSGEREQVTRVPLPNPVVVTDQAGAVRFAWGLDGELLPRTLRFDAAAGQWQPLPPMAGPLGSLRPLQFLPDNRRFLALLSESGEAACLYLLASDNDERKKIACEGEFDVGGLMPSSAPGIPLAAVTSVAMPSVRLLGGDPADTSLYEALGKAFAPALVSFVDISDDGRRVLFEVNGDREPGRVYLHDRGDNSTRLVFARRPALPAQRLATTRAVSLAARDGTRLHGFLTLPSGAGAGARPPLVVMPHGGPHGPHDTWFFDADAQWLAANGYAVLKVNFRGSGGFGEAFQRRGFRQWGGAIQDDIIDATRWAVAEGLVEGSRICIAGGSFGAYSALMSAIKAPDLYRCVVGYAGVYDLAAMYERGDVPGSPLGRRYLRDVLGEDEAELAAFSPLRQVDRLQAPVLLVHGTSDWRTPIAHATELKAALERRRHPVQWLAVANEGHGFVRRKNRALYLQTMARFLDRHIGPAAAASTADPAL